MRLSLLVAIIVHFCSAGQLAATERVISRPKSLVIQVGKVEPVALSAFVISPSGVAETVPGRISPAPAPKAEKTPKAVSQNVLQNYLINHAGMREVEALLVDPRMNNLEPGLRVELSNAGDSVRSARTAMMPDAKTLDDRDAVLVVNGAKLNKTTQDLNKEGADLRQQISDHNGRCNPAPDEATYRWCLTNATRLNTWRGDFNQRVGTHNNAVDEHNKQVAQHKTNWDAFVSRIQAWEKKASDLIERINMEFRRPRPGAETCELVDPPQGGVCLYSCPSGEVVSMDPPVPGHPETCPKKIQHRPRPPANSSRGGQ